MISSHSQTIKIDKSKYSLKVNRILSSNKKNCRKYKVEQIIFKKKEKETANKPSHKQNSSLTLAGFQENMN